MKHPPQRSPIEGRSITECQAQLRTWLGLSSNADGTTPKEDAQRKATSVPPMEATDESTIENLSPILGLQVIKETFHNADFKLKKPLSKMGIESQVEEQSAELEHRQPPASLIKFTMAERWLETKPSQRPVKKPAWKKLWRDAYASLWHEDESVWAAVKARKQVLPSASMKAAILAVKKGYPLKVFNPFQRYDRDQVAGEHATILRSLPGNTMYLAVDRNNFAMAFLFPNVVQTLFGDDTVLQIADHIRRYNIIEPPEGCDAKRTPTQDKMWLKHNKRFQKVKPPPKPKGKAKPKPKPKPRAKPKPKARKAVKAKH